MKIKVGSYYRILSKDTVIVKVEEVDTTKVVFKNVKLRGPYSMSSVDYFKKLYKPCPKLKAELLK